jgi:HAD superfamily hydrolase (TIGR01549 family)
MSEITAVLFDWDFTLAYTLAKDASSVERTTAMFHHVNLDYTREQIESAWQRFKDDVAQGRIQGKAHPQTKQDLINLYRGILMRLGHDDTGRDLTYRIYEAYAYLPTNLYQDALPTLQSLQEREVALGILSNHTTSVRPEMERLVGEFVPSHHITISEEEGVHKPGKTIFRRAASRLRMPANQCLYVGDNLAVDAIGAVQKGDFGLGLWVDRRNTAVKQQLPSNVYRITSLNQVIHYVNHLSA